MTIYVFISYVTKTLEFVLVYVFEKLITTERLKTAFLMQNKYFKLYAVMVEFLLIAPKACVTKNKNYNYLIFL